MTKRIIAGLMCLVLLFAAVPVAAFAANEEQATVDTGEVSIEGTNGFGTLLSQEISESQAEADAQVDDYEAGYTVTDLVIEGATATVTYDSMEEAVLVVALYTEDGMQMLTSATATVTADATEATVEFTGTMPEYFLASAYLVDTYDLSPLCAAYDTPMYTREMQELLASTVEDYDADRVLNLDDDNTTNFAVYADTTKVIEAAEGINQVASIDDENATYVIKNADEQITSLTAGDVFVYPYAENEILIVKVAEITTSGTTVTITGAELEMEEAFNAVKIEGMDTTENMEIDEDSVAEGVIYEGLVDDTDPDAFSPMAQEGGTEISKSASFKVDKTIIEKGDASVKVSGSLAFSMKVEFSYYVSSTRQYIDFRIENKLKGAIKVTGELGHEWPLCKAKYYPVPGVDIAIEPTFKIEVSGEIEFSASVKSTCGFTYDTQKGISGHNGKPEFDVDIEAEVTVFIGIDLKPQVEIAEGWIADLEMEMPVGVEFTIKGTGHGIATRSESDLSWHECANCLDIEPTFKGELGVEIEFLKCKWLKVSATALSITRRLGHLYFSFDHLKAGAGLCPYQTYRVTFHLKDGINLPIRNTGISLSDGTAIGETNDQGILVRYLPEGEYSFSATILGEKVKRSVTVYESCLVILKQGNDYGTDNSKSNGIWGSVASSKIADFEKALKEPVVELNGHTYTLFYNVAATWDAAQAYCASMGGHLATITSAEENSFLYEYMRSCGHENAYWGLTDSTTEGTWEWCTGEPVEYMNWASGEPNDDYDSAEDYGMFWDGKPNGYWNDGRFGDDGQAFLCEWDFEVVDTRVYLNGHAYQVIINNFVSWEEAEAYCEANGGHLATITSQEENDFIYDYLVSSGYRNAYFGLSDAETEGTWEWCTDEPVTFTNWPSDQPDDRNGTENYGMYWDHYQNGEWNDGPFSSEYVFICEWDSCDTGRMASPVLWQKTAEPSPNAVYPGDYGTEVTDAYTLKTASFTGLVPDEQYILLAMKSIEVTDPLASDNLLFIDQGVALEDGTLSFQYVQRETADVSYVVACGASNKELNDAQITFPEMTADGELQVVAPTVVYDGVTLTEGRDYVIVGTVDFTEAGEYTCYIRGIHNYTGLVECAYTVAKAAVTEIARGWSGATQWTLTDDGVITFSGSGNMKNYGYGGGQPWAEYADRITAVVIEDGVTAVGSGAFMNLSKLESVTLPTSGLNKIGEAAFYGCSALKEIYIPDGVYTIWAYTFKNCAALTDLRLPATLVKVDQGAFETCTGLTELFIPGQTEIIGAWSFKGCSGLTAVDMQWADATQIRAGAFKNCTALTDVILPTGIQILGDSAFYGIGAASFTIPATVTEVGPWCFARAALDEVTFAGDAPAIGEGAFNKITLTAFYPAGNATWTSANMLNYGGTVTWKAR